MNPSDAVRTTLGRVMGYFQGRRHTLAEHLGRKPAHPVDGRVIVVTGASSGIGASAAVRLARAGASVVAVARRETDLLAVAAADGCAGAIHVFPADLTREDERAALVQAVQDRFGVPDVVVNNAGRSIRRPVADSLDRFHDYQRTVDLNYLAPAHLTLEFAKGMVGRGSGHFVNVSTAVVQAWSTPQFSAYGASKAALTVFSRSVGAELLAQGVTTTTVFYPLVRTPMAAPTGRYRQRPALSPEAAGEWIQFAAEARPVSVTPRGSARILVSLTPERVVDRALTIGI